MHGVDLARALHVLAVVTWIGGAAMTTSVILPAIRSGDLGDDRLKAFHAIERRFIWQARTAVLVVGATGFYLMARLDLLARFSSATFWWMHAMIGVWTLFMVVLFVVFHANEATFQTTWFVISLFTELAVVLVLRTHRPAFRSKPSGLLLWTTVVMSIVALAIPFLGPFASVFGFVPLSALEIGAVLIIVSAYIAATEEAKVWFYRTREQKGAGG